MVIFILSPSLIPKFLLNFSEIITSFSFKSSKVLLFLSLMHTCSLNFSTSDGTTKEMLTSEFPSFKVVFLYSTSKALSIPSLFFISSKAFFLSSIVESSLKVILH